MIIIYASDSLFELVLAFLRSLQMHQMIATLRLDTMEMNECYPILRVSKLILENGSMTVLKLAVDFYRDHYVILPINPFNHLVVNEINSGKLFCIRYKGIIHSVTYWKSSNVLSSEKINLFLGIVRIYYIISFLSARMDL